MTADVDQPARMRESAALERRGDALIRGAGEREKHDERQGRAQRRWARRDETGATQGSRSASPYFSMRE